MASSGSEQNVHWYYKIDGKEAGPAIISRLRQMAREGTLTSEDLVRKGMTGEWVRAGTVSEIQARARTVTVDVPEEPERTRIEIQRSSRLNDLRLSLQYAITSAIGSVADRLGQIRTLTGYVIVAAILMYLISTALKWKNSDEPAVADPLATYK